MQAEIERMRELMKCMSWCNPPKREYKANMDVTESRRPDADVLLQCKANGTGSSYTVPAGKLYECLVGIRGRSQIVNVEGVVVGLSTFRKWARLMKGDPLTMSVYDDRLEFSADGHLTIIRYGAWDKANGAGGYDVEIVPVG